MKKNSTYKRLNAYHKARYRFYRALQYLGGGTRFPSEYWEPGGAESNEYMSRLGYRLTKQGWKKRQ